MINEEQAKVLAQINSLPKATIAFITSTKDKYFVMGVKPYHFFCYDDEGMEMLSYFSKESAYVKCKELKEKHSDGWYEYGVFKLSSE
jgi:hypothetical protein